MESRQRRVWHQAAGAYFYTRFARCHARLRRNFIQRAGALIPYQACGLDKQKQNICLPTNVLFLLVGEGGFGPPKSVTTDLQSAPFGRSGIPPYKISRCGAGGRTRTPDLLITNQLLYQLSYTSTVPHATEIL